MKGSEKLWLFWCETFDYQLITQLRLSGRQKNVGDLCWPHAFLYYEQKFGRTGKEDFIDIFWKKYVIMKHHARVHFFVSLEMELLCRTVMSLWVPYSSCTHIYHAERQYSWALYLSFRTQQWRLMKTAGLCHLPLTVIFHSVAAHSKSVSEAYPQVLGSVTQGLVPSSRGFEGVSSTPSSISYNMEGTICSWEAE